MQVVRKAWRATRSGFRRYPRALVDSALGTLPGLLHHHERHAIAKAYRGWERHALAATWLGHGSVLVRHGGKTILVDPVFSHRIGMSIGGRTMGLPRLMPLPLAPMDLPPIDVILITHAHFDHLDRPSLRALGSPKTTLITARRTSSLIPSGFGRIVELDWRQGLQLDGLHVSAIRPRHWGARAGLDRRRGYNSYVLRDRHGQGVLLAGDTAMTDAFDHLRDVTLAALGIGAYEPWANAHATPEEAWEMFNASGAAYLLPVHHSTFELGDEPIAEPMERLNAAASAARARIIEPVPGSIWAA
jgi:L-ascorbate metabolism protein UlaG (beta-lactamase superfamily)